MYLSRLELFGFKSFPYRLELEFGQGLTAIVGPNGCGKTNLFEAIRWALGEQSAKTLRSEAMEDVIFSGTKDQKPLSLAEATLIFNNEDRRLPLDYSEVEITRRLFRSGESEYYLAKQLCRLKDITDLLLNTGLGADSYSVIELRMIDSVLSEDPAERRLLFEEAAGVAKYRKQRKETLRKLEATEADLLRLTDILAEVEKRVRSLKRQVRQAESYQEIRTTLVGKEKLLGGRTLFSLAREEGEIHGQSRTLAKSREEKSKARVQKDSEVEGLQKKVQDNESGLRRLQGELDRVSDALRTLEQEAAGVRERRESFERGIKERERDIGELLEKIATAEAREKEGRTELEAKAGDIQGTELALSEKQEALSRVDGEYLQQKVTLGAIQQRIFEKVREESEEKNQLSLFTVRLEGISHRAERLIQERMSEEESIRRLAQELRGAEAEREEARQVLEKLKEEEGFLREARIRSEEEAQRLAQKSRDLAQGLEIDRKELSVLEDLESRREGYSDGVRILLTEQTSFRTTTLAEVLEVSSTYSKAIEATLGNKLEWVLLEHAEYVKTAIAWLKAKRRGKVTLVPADLFGSGAKSKARKPEGSDGFARDFVKVKDSRYAGAVEELLRDVVVVRDYDTALLLLGRKENRTFRFVTLTGESLEASGIVTYLGEGEVRSGSLLDRPKRIEELHHEMSMGDFDLKEARRAQERGEAVVYEAVKALEQGVARYEALAQRVRDAEAVIEKARFQSERARERISVLGAEAKTLTEEQNTLAFSMKDREASFAVAVEEKEREESFLTSEEARMEALEGKRRSLSLEVNDLKVRLAEERGEREKLLAEVEALSRMKADSLEGITRKRGEQAASESRILDLQESVARGESEMAKVREERAALIRERGKIEGESQGLFSVMQQTESALHALIQEGEEISEKTHAHSLRLSQIGMERQALVARLKEEYDLAVEPLESDGSLDALKAETEELRMKLKRFGAVNLVALEEYQEEEKRFTFLSGQKEDLEKAKGDLRASIAKIDETARVLFTETFAKVQEGFRKVFSTLFSGGEAEVVLSGSEDPLEAQIEILANPEGKRMKAISLLSGGERTLTAISLLFGIYLVKPAPFCVLDEVDAPLDDVNIGRFVTLMNEFKKNTQFAIITHNKKTMEAADRLYGVTMEEPGVSKVVSVRFDRAKVLAPINPGPAGA